MDSLKKLEEINQTNEGIFNKIFGRFSKSNQQSAAPQQNTKSQKKQPPPQGKNVMNFNMSVGYKLNGNYIQNLHGSYPNAHLQETWEQPEFDWLIGSKFNANAIYLDEYGLHFSGKWYGGIFEGYDFLDGSGSNFIGGAFNGDIYSAPNSTFNVKPQNFIRGKYMDYQNGILGTMPYSRDIEDTSEYIELIRVPINWYVTIGDKKGKNITFKMIKKIDDVNTNFIFKIMPNIKKPIGWSTIRKNYESLGFIEKGGNFNLLGKEFAIKNISSIIVSSKPRKTSKSVIKEPVITPNQTNTSQSQDTKKQQMLGKIVK